jgi:hypothetical protein
VTNVVEGGLRLTVGPGSDGPCSLVFRVPGTTRIGIVDVRDTNVGLTWLDRAGPATNTVVATTDVVGGRLDQDSPW